MSRIQVKRSPGRSIQLRTKLIVSLPKQTRIVKTRMTSDGADREVVCFEIVDHESDRGKLIGKGVANMRCTAKAAELSRVRLGCALSG